MNLIELLQSPWAILPSSLTMIQDIYTQHVNGEPVDIDAIEARLGRPLANDQQDYVVREGAVGVLQLAGTISPKANLFTRVSGGASAQVFAQQVDSMAADPRLKSAVIDVDTPGGNVLGLPAAASALARLAAEKPTVVVCTGQICSGGYWIGSAANRVYLSGLTDVAGSIGVVGTHTYNPRSANGPQTTEITAGKYKRIASDTAPLSKEGRAYLQAQVDEIYRVFVDTVAVNRRVSVDQVLSHMADGRVFIGQQALDAGLADGIATVDDMVEQLATNPDKFAKRGKAVFALGGLPAATTAEGQPPITSDEQPPVTTTTTEDQSMTPQELAAKFAAENPEAAAVLRAEGATAETKRAADVRAAALPGHEALIERLAADGKTTGAEAAMAVVAAEKAMRTAQATARRDDAVAPVKQTTTEADDKAAAVDKAAANTDLLNNPEALDTAVRAYMTANPGTNYLAALKAVNSEA